MKSQLIALVCLLFFWNPTTGQVSNLPAPQAHSHNDYLQKKPFHLAYQHRFGSIEADLFFRNDTLFVAHEWNEISPSRRFNNLYLSPLQKKVRKNKGFAYKDKNQKLQLLIDIKTPYVNTLEALVKELIPYQNILYPEGTVQVVISGNTPPPDKFSDYPEFIFFDGRPEITYSETQLRKVALISQSFMKYSKWKGTGPIPEADRQTLQGVVASAHRLNKPFRFWASPDTPDSWNMLISLKADYINTDKIEELSRFMKNQK